jgi:predicted GIY-YIG superfamily endonuclease
MAYYVYLLASDRNGTLYLGVTNDIVRRVFEHKSKVVPGFTKRYAVDKLVWFEVYDDPTSAITREGTEEMAARLEDPTHRTTESSMDRPVSANFVLSF